LAKPYRSFWRSAGRRQAIADIFFGLTIVAALRPDPIASCQRGQQRPTLSAEMTSDSGAPFGRERYAGDFRSRGILLQKSKVASVRIFGETLKREAIDDSDNLSRATEVPYEFCVRR
jgi:hypothetical protein